jgi:conjugative relaxase-like TrwC/TraI family protein
MLTIRAAKNPEYYERREFARDDYYEESGEAPGQWVGRSAETLDLEGSPERGQLGTLLKGVSPRTGEVLPGGRGRRPSNAGFDLTFTAPKSVSVLLAIGDERTRQAILAAQERAARAGLDYLERHECFARRGTDGVEVVPAEGFVGGMYMHEMARSGDPHLHTHVVIANRVLAADGRGTAPDMRPVYAAAKTAGTLAEAELRQELSRSLGVQWRDVVNGTAEIEGVPQAVLDHFSQRHSEIAELATARGWLTERGIEEIQRETRDRKPQLDRDVAREQWRARAAEQGFGAREITALLGRSAVRRPKRYRTRIAEHLAGPDGLTRQESTFTRREVLQGLAAAYPEGISAAELEKDADRFLSSRGVAVTPRTGHQPERYTTLDMLATEARLLEVAGGRSRRVPRVGAAQVNRVIARAGKLGEDQADAVRHLTSGTARTRLLEARAGYGKTTALRAVAKAYDAQGVPVVGTAWQGQAAQALQREAGIKGVTAAGLLRAIERGEEPIGDRAVLIVDEAGMMPTRALARLADEVAGRGGRLILVGDRDQLPSIDAGGAFASLGDRLGVARLSENRRQRDELQRAVAGHLAEGRAGAALDLLAEHGRFQAFDDARQARAELIEEWAFTSLDTPENALILAHDRREVAELNLLARAQLDAEGRLGKKRLVAYGREWAAGDRMRFKLNDYRPDLDVRNQARATVTRVDRARQTVTVRTDDGRDVKLPPDYLEHVDYGYAGTGHASQGATVDRTYLLATPDRGGREWGYVAGSRHRIDLRVYAVHHDREEVQRELERTWLKSQAKTLAFDRMHPDDRELALGRAARRIAELEAGAGIQKKQAQRARPDRSREDDREQSSQRVRRKRRVRRRRRGEGDGRSL